jgi:type I restriction enzyme S subunit
MSSGNGHAQTAWKTVRLGEICERIDYGFTASADYSVKEPRFLRITDIQNGNVNWDAVPGCRISASEIAQNRLRDGDIVFARTGATTGKSFLLENPPNAVFASYLIRLRARREVDPHYMALYFQTHDYWTQIRAGARGGAQPNFNASMLACLRIPICPLDAQRRIAARLREQLSILVEARTALEAQLKTAKALPAANLRAVFESEEARRWPRAKLEELCEIVATQVDPTDSKFADLPHVNGENIESGTLELNGVRSAREDRMTSGKYLFEQDDVLYSKLRPYLRKVAIAPWRGLCSADMYPLRMRRDRLHERYAAWLLLSDEFTKYAIGESQRSRMPKLNREQLFGWNAPVPPLETQCAIANRLDTDFSASKELRKSIDEKLNALAKLPAALLRSAFRPNGD